MRTENGLLIDPNEVGGVVQAADVFTIGFRQIPERLLVDTRCDDITPPFVALVQPLSGVAERYFWLGKHRPTLGPPQRFVFVPWPHSIPFLFESGMWRSIAHRILATGHPQAREIVEKAAAQLIERDRAENVAAVAGPGYREIWPRVRGD